jgi:anti-sigma regulatory factor (Ser/Thr protein kinase)
MEEQPRRLVVPGRFERLTEIAAFVTQAAHEAGLNDDEVFHVEMAVDEACSNIIEHAYAAQSGDIDLACRCPMAGQIEVVIRDIGPPFRPEEVSPPTVSAPVDLDNLNGGGLGLYFMRKLMDEVRFESVPGQGNTLTMLKRTKSE